MTKTNTNCNSIEIKLLFVIFLFILVSCKPTVNESQISFEVDQSFDVCGSFSVENESNIYFAKRKFNPCVILFDEKGTRLDSISLNNAKKELNEITNVWMCSSDSVFVYSYLTNTMVVLDNKGEIQSVKNREGINDDKGQAYELYLPYGNIEASNNLIFTACLLKEYGNNEYGAWDSFLAYSQNMKNGYLLYNEDSGFVLKKTELDGFLEEDSLLFLPFWQTTVVNNQLIFNSKYSRYIYFLNNDLSVKGSIKIIPDSIKTVQPIKLNGDITIADEIALISDIQNQKGSIINHIFFDKNKQNYIISILNFNVNTSRYNPYMFYVYDENYQKIKEIYIDNNGNYNGVNCIYINSCLLIERTDSDDEKKRFFEVFKI